MPTTIKNAGGGDTIIPTVPQQPVQQPAATPFNATATPVDVSTLTSTAPFTLPPAPSTPNYDLSSLPSIASLLNPAPTATEQQRTDLQNKLLGDTATLGTKAAAQTTAEDTAAKALGAPTGLSDFSTQLTDVNNQIQTLAKENAAIPLQIQQDFAGRGATVGGVDPIQTGQLRQNSIKALGLSAIAQTLQGNIASAQATASRAVDLQFAPVQAEIDYLNQALALNKDNLSREDQKRADELQVELQDRQTQLDQQKDDKNTIIGWAAAAMKNNPNDPAVQLAAQKALQTDDLQTALNLVGQYQSDPIATQQAVANLALTRSETNKNNASASSTAPVPGYNGDFAATIQLAASANKQASAATRASVTQSLQSSIAQGDYKSAYQTIVQQTKANLTGTTATRFENALTLGSTLGDLQTALQSYADAGGDTNILTGTQDDIQTKIGALTTNPKYASLAVQLDTAYQNYRLMLTGANFSSAEASAYASVLPSKSNTLALNLAKIQGAKAAADSTVEGNIKSVVGDGGVYIKQYAEGASAPATQVPADPAFTEWLQANNLLN